jgi:hypothetical protein
VTAGEFDQSPVPEVRASDRDREVALEVLASASIDGQLSLTEYSERVDVVLAARTRAELEQVSADLQQSQPIAQTVVPSESVSEPMAIRAVFSADARRGRWKVPPHLKVRTILGDCRLELQAAVLTSHRTVIEAHTTLGSITILVPEGIEVEFSGNAILGTNNSEIRGEPTPGAPVIEIRAKAVLGEVNVKHPPGPDELGPWRRQNPRRTD